MAIPKIALKTGARLPMLGLGTWKSKAQEAKQAVTAAIDAGFRHIDCAYDYDNESMVGDAIQSKITEGIVKREDLFITSKLWVTYFTPDRVVRGLRKSLESLKLDYLDLYLLHWPFALKFTMPMDILPRSVKGEPLLDERTDYVDTWKELIKLKDAGYIRSIGVSNFNEYQINRLSEETSWGPDVHQFECHPYLDQDSLVKFCQARDIAVTGYSPFGSPDSRIVGEDSPNLFEESALQNIAKKHGKTEAQILLRYQIQRGIAVIPKSVTPSRIESNINIFDFFLNDQDMKTVRGLNRDWRMSDVDGWASKSHKYYPFRKDYSE